jgi:hypothetical protein
MRYMDPLTDFGFKKIFTEPLGQPLLISLLNDVLALPEPLSARGCSIRAGEGFRKSSGTPVRSGRKAG